MLLPSSLPVPSILASPVRDKVSTWSPSVKLTELNTVSSPFSKSSITVSPALSTM